MYIKHLLSLRFSRLLSFILTFALSAVVQGQDLTIADVSVNEDVGNASLTVTLSQVTGADVTVNWSTSNGTASSASDYTNSSGTLTIPSGSTTGTIVVPVTDDANGELDEYFYVYLSNPHNATITDNHGEVTILESDIATLSWDDGSTHLGTSTRSGTMAGAHYFKILTHASLNGGWRTALRVTSGEANLYMRKSGSSLPTANSARYSSARTAGFCARTNTRKTRSGTSSWTCPPRRPGS